jgi:eukaryotic-like serine/threonine-protein kinase
LGLPVHIGEVVEGRYKIVRPLADGGMGMVFLAEHWLIKRKVAIKILHADLATDVVMLRRFMNEALAAGTLGHPHIVESTDMGFTKNQLPFIVFEYLEGVSLADEIAQTGPMPVARALAILDQIASALGAAHGAGIIHRDLKSDNIFLALRAGERDHVKVLDFGISRFLTAVDKTALGGNLLGTPEFMAPEQVTAPDEIDHRVDIYALGVLLFEMLTGRVPFVLAKQNDIEAAHELLGRVVNDPPPALAVADAPRGLDVLVATLLAKQPADRYQTTADVQRAIAQLIAPLPVPRTISREVAILSDRTVSRNRLTPTALAREVMQLGRRWSLAGEELVLEIHDRQLTKLAQIVAFAASIADELELQPRVAIEYPRLRLVLPNASAVVELVFAARIEQWLREHGW